jgi:hypothetical protein
VNTHFAWNVPKECGVCTYGRRIASGEHIELDSLRGKVPGEAGSAEHPNTGDGWKYIGDQ